MLKQKSTASDRARSSLLGLVEASADSGGARVTPTTIQLAAYAENRLRGAERQRVQHWLTRHHEVLEDVLYARRWALLEKRPGLAAVLLRHASMLASNNRPGLAIVANNDSDHLRQRSRMFSRPARWERDPHLRSMLEELTRALDDACRTERSENGE